MARLPKGPQRVDRAALWDQTGYKPHEAQRAFHDSKARYKVAACGRRFGKSRQAAAEIEPLLFQTHPDGTPTLSWIVGPTYATGKKEFEYVWNDIVLGFCRGMPGIRKAFNVRTGEMYIEMPWGSRVEVRSADHPDGLVSEGLDYALLSEAAKHDPRVWQKYIRPALADWRGKATFPSTPEGLNWFHEVYIQGTSASEEYVGNGGEWESFHFPSWANAVVYPGGLADAEIQGQIPDKPLTDSGIEIGSEAWWEYIYASPANAWFLQEIAAEFRSFVGQIYPEWSEETHVYENVFGKSYEFNPAWPNYLAQDYGFTNPTVALDVQVDPSDNVYVWREYYEREKPTHIHAQEIKSRPNPSGYRLDAGFGDAADPASVETMSRIVVATQAEKDAKDVTEGIALMHEFLTPIEVQIRGPEGDGQFILVKRPRLYVSSQCPKTIYEFNNYRAKETHKIDQQNVKEEPRKYADHSLDALRYMLMHLYKLGARYHLSDVVFSSDAPGRSGTPSELSGNDSFGSPEPVGASGEPFFSTSDSSVFTLASGGM